MSLKNKRKYPKGISNAIFEGFYFKEEDVKEFIKKVDGWIEEIENADTLTRIELLFKLRNKINEEVGVDLI